MSVTFKLLFIILFLTSDSFEWLNDFEKAKKIAQIENKYILLNFSGSDWCVPCIQMKKDIFEQEVFLNFAQSKLVLLQADFPRLKKNQLDATQKEHNEKLATIYNSEGIFPLTLLLDKEGNIVKKWEGIVAKSPQDFIESIP